MKVLAINGSARADGNTHAALEYVAKYLEEENIGVEIIDLVNLNINPFSFEKEKMNDDIPMIFEKLKKANGLILASPVYYSNVTSRMQMFIERIGSLAGKNTLKGKVGASIAICRRQGANFAYAAMNYFFGIKEMPIATSSYWNDIIAKDKGEFQKDKEGLQILENLAKNMAYMIKKLDS
ncbi:MAG: flavodoxin family protein [Promethearchaeota archaeon]